MANSRDVKLVIKARDEASAILKQVQKAIQQHDKTLATSNAKSKTMTTGLASLAKEADHLSVSLAKAKGKLDFAKQVEVMAGAATKMGSEFADLKVKLASTSEQTKKAKTDLDGMRDAAEKMRQTLAAERVELNKVNNDISKHNATISKGEKKIKEYSASIAKAEEKLTSLRQDLTGATEAQNKATAADDKAARTAEVLRQRLADLRAERQAARSVTVPRVSQKAGVSQAQHDALSASKAAGIASIDAEIGRVESTLALASRDQVGTGKAVERARAAVKAIEDQIRATDKLDATVAKLVNTELKVSKARASLVKDTALQSQFTAAVQRSETVLRDASAQIQVSAGAYGQLTAEQKRLEIESGKLASALERTEEALREVNAEATSSGLQRAQRDVEALTRSVERQTQRLQAMQEMAARKAGYNDGAGGVNQSGQAAQLRKLNAQLTKSQEDAAAFKVEIESLKKSLLGVKMNPRVRKEINELQLYVRAAEADARDLAMQIRRVGEEGGQMGSRMGSMWRSQNVESRTALSLFQRIRGQLLAMASAYVGLYGAVNMVTSVTQAYMKQEAALSRLGVVFDGNSARMGTEMDWLRREANRIGIELGTLADQYTKFAVTSKMSGFSESSTKEIFTSVSEAARVNKLSLEEVQGVYLALSQAISKGKWSAEELRQQLGERLPGAMSLMAEAMGVTVAELDKMMEQGQLLADEENMLKFADLLTQKFGKQLPISLRTFTTEWGRMQNTIYQAQLNIANGGLIESLTDVMRILNEFANSKEGVEFFTGLGHAMGEVVAWAPTLVKNIDLIAKGIGILLGFHVAKYFVGVIASVKSFIMWTGMMNISLTTSGTAIRGWLAAIMLAPGAFGKAAVAARAFGAAMMTLGPIAAGLAAVGFIASFLGDWESGVDNITSAHAEHSRIMDQILAKYDEAKGKTYDWKQAVDEKNASDLAANLPNMMIAGDDQAGILWDTMREKRGYINDAQERDRFGVANMFSTVPKNIRDKFYKDYARIWDDLGSLTKDEVGGIVKTMDEMSLHVANPQMKANIIQTRNELEKWGQSQTFISQVITVMRELGHEIADTEGVTDRFGTSMQEMAADTDKAVEGNNKLKESFDNFAAPLNEAIKKAGFIGPAFEKVGESVSDPFDIGTLSVNQMVVAMEALKSRQGEVQAAFKQFAQDGSLDILAQKLAWMKDIPGLSQLFDKFFSGEMSKALGDKNMSGQDFTKLIGTTKGSEMMKLVEGTSKLAEVLGVSAKDLLTVMSYETGGTFDKWQKGGVGGKHRGLIQWSPDNISAYGLSAESTIEEQLGQVGKYLTDRGVKPGMGLLEIYAAINAGHVSKVNASDAGNGGRPGDVTWKVNNDMGGHRSNADSLLRMFEGSADYGGRQGEAAREAVEEAEKVAEAAVKAREAKEEDLALVKEQIALESMRVNGQEREAFIQEKLAAFKRANKNVSEEELALLREQYGTMYDLSQIKSKDEQKKEAEKKHQEEINNLEAQRNALLEQRKYYEEQGDTEKVKTIDEQLVSINAQLEAAIDKFIAFWAAAGGEGSAAAIAQLEATKLGLKETGKEALLTAAQVNEKWAGGLSDSISAFAIALGQGKNAFKSLRDAFLQFASDFLIEIGKMIVKQTMLNMLQGSGGGGGFGGMIMKGLGAITSGIFHTGKAAGAASNGVSRRVPASLFTNAPRFHDGKLPGLKTGEMAAIIEQSEEVLPENHPRHAKNFARMMGEESGASGDGTTIVNAFDPQSFLEQGLSTGVGRKVMMNFVRANKSVIRKALE